jgi:hypothetical protein
MPSKAMPERARTRVREAKCTTCQGSFPAGALVDRTCPGCAGLVALPLRGAGGRFLPGLNQRPGSAGSGTTGGAA